MNMGKWLSQAGKAVAEAIFPTGIYCLCCGSVIDASRPTGLCDHCAEKLHWVGSLTCDQCGKPIGHPGDQAGLAPQNRLCHDCRKRRHWFDRGYTCAQYGLYERAMIMDLKYQDRSYIGWKLGRIMAERIALEGLKVDAVVPVPLHADRYESRGYNQAELMARPVAERLGVPLWADLLRRVKSTDAMKDLGIWERMEMVQDAFALSKTASSLEGRRLLVVEINRRLLIPKSERLKPLISRGFANRMASISESKASNNALFQKIA